MQVLDSFQLRDVTMNDDELMREIVNVLVSEAAKQIEDMYWAVEKQDPITCTRLAHVLGGACANLGAMSMRRVCGSIEAGAGHGDLGQCRSDLGLLKAELEKFRDAVATME